MKKIEDEINRIRLLVTHQTLITDLELLRNQLRKCSLTDYLKVIALVESLREWVRTFTFDYFYMDHRRDSWEINHIFDMQNQAPTFVRLVYSLLLMSSNELVPNIEPINLPRDWSNDHPFLINYNLQDGVNMKKFFEKRGCGDDKVEMGLKLPDLISNTILRSIQRQDDKRWLRLLRRIWANRSLVHSHRGHADYYKTLTFPSTLGKIMPSNKIEKHFYAMKSLSK